MIICITGMPGSGKSTVADILKKKGFKVIELSDFIKGEMRKEGIVITQRNIEQFAASIRKKLGKGITAKLAVKSIRSLKGDIAISGIRDTDEVNYFRKSFMEAPVIAVVAPQIIRYKRIRERHRPTDPKDFREFLWREAKNRRLGVEKVIRSADLLISNTGTRKDLAKNITKALSILKSKDRD